MKKNKRTDIDFSEHEHRIEIFKNENGKEIRIDHFQVGNSRINYIQFINTDEIMSVTGDFGNWIFCRPFVPSSEGFVSDHYWYEKLSISSTQKYKSFDSDLTVEALEDEMNRMDEDFDVDYVERKEEYRAYLERCISESDYEWGYVAYAYQEHPSWMDSEDVIFCEKTNVRLEIIFDAFDEICNRLKDKEMIEFENSDYVACPTCKGKCSILSDNENDDPIDCPECNGTGKITYEKEEM